MIKSSDYWKKREIAEKKWQKQAEKNIQAYNQHIAQMYQNTIDEINRQIKSDLGFADNKLITAKDMQEYETLAKEAVKKANALRAEGHYVTRKDFSKDVNYRLKIYNATMRINRNEILKSKIGARLVELGVEQETDLTKKLWNDYTKEKERQAGILGITAKSDLWTSKEVQGQIYKQIANANFSKRIWADIDGLKGTLNGLVSTAIIRGDNPKSMAKWLTGMVSATVGNQRYVAERLARTETARVQFEAQQKSILDAGYKYVKWMAEGNACKLCREIAYKDNGYDENGVYKAKDVPDIPVHPNCMCSISAHWVDNSDFDRLFKSTDIKDSSVDDIINLGDEFNKKYHVSDLLGNKQEITNLISKYRPIGSNVPKDRWVKGSNSKVKNTLNIAFSHYPADWVNYLSKNGEYLKAGKNKRGFYYHALLNARGYLLHDNDGKYNTIYSSLNTTTAWHEIGHFVEDHNPDVERIEREFLKKRTKGEEATRLYDVFNGWLAYSRDETTKKDSFINPYIGKEYPKGTEVLSIGLESLFEPKEGQLTSMNKDGKQIRKFISDDPEYLNLILGILLKG